MAYCIASRKRRIATFLLAAAFFVLALFVTAQAPPPMAAPPPPPPPPPSQSSDQPTPPPAAALLSPPTKPIEFDVATFKINKSGGVMPYLTIPVGGDGFTAQNRPFHDIIRYAFAKGRGGAYQISGQPSWVDDDRYDIQAKVAVEDLPEWQKLNAVGQKVALQGFLIEYLKLKFHPDPTPHPYYALVVGKNGPKLKESKPDDSFKTPDGHTVTGTALALTGPFELTAQNCTLERFADLLTGYANRGVLDKTGLPGAYNFVLHFDPIPDPRVPDGQGVPIFAASPDAVTPVIISAVKELGLQIVPATGPMDGMVIDHIERPPDN